MKAEKENFNTGGRLEFIKKLDNNQINLTNSVRKKPNPIKDSKINWENYNWPLCLKLIHFELEEINEKIRYVFTLLYLNFFIGAILFLTKFFVQIFIRNNLYFIITAFVLYFVVVFCRFMVLFSAYRGLFLEDDYKIVYKVFACVFIIFSICNAIIDAFIFDGIIKIINFTEKAETDVNSVSIMLLLYVEYFLNAIFLILDIIALIGYCIIEKKYDN